MTNKLIRLPDVERATGLKRTAIYTRVKRGQFPAPVPIGGRAVAWVEDEISDWIHAQIAVRDRGVAP